jgi:uncharacterized protein
MKKLTEFLVQSIVSHPDEVKVEEIKDEGGLTVLSIHVNPEDMGEVIGKGGRIIKSLRSIIRAKAIKTGCRVRVDLI